MHARAATGREGGEGSVACAMERDRCAVPLITSPNSRPLNQRVTGKEDVINKGDASQGGKRRGELKPVALAVAITLAIAITLG